MELFIEVTREEDVPVVAVAGELDMSTAPDLSDALDELVAEPKVVVDLAKLEFIDSTGLAALLGAHRAMQQNGGTLELRSPQPMVVNVVETTGLDAVFEIRLS
ncbi:MAG: STAS domain-containing protein [Nocardioidaceae bacterium]